MQMRPQIQIKSALKALTDVVLPAVDPNNKLAQEQGKLVIGLLSLLAQQLPIQYQFDRDELKRLVACAQQLHEAARGGSGTQAALAELAAAARAGSQALFSAGTTPEDLQQAVRALRAATGKLVTQIHRDGEAGSRAAVRKLVLAMSKEQLLRERSMLLMQGWEPDPAAIPPLASLLDTNPR